MKKLEVFILLLLPLIVLSDNSNGHAYGLDDHDEGAAQPHFPEFEGLNALTSEPAIYAIASVIFVSLLSLVGILTILLSQRFWDNVLIYTISFAAGALLGDAFIHLLPEIIEETGFGLNISSYVLFGIVSMFIIEKFLHWHHCHQVSESHTNIQPYAIMNLIGDVVHNIIDGLIIGSSYLISIPVGIATTIAVMLHEIPQEIGDFGVLIYGGLSRGRALVLNFLTALTAVLGAVVSLVVAASIEGATTFLVPLAAGQFIYIAVADLIPELHKETDWKKSLIQLALFVLGVVVMAALLLLEQ